MRRLQLPQTPSRAPARELLDEQAPPTSTRLRSAQVLGSARGADIALRNGSEQVRELSPGHAVMRLATSYFVTEVRCPGVSLPGIALSASSPRL